MSLVRRESAKDPKIWLERVNEKGVPGIWECEPYCIPDRLNKEEPKPCSIN